MDKMIESTKELMEEHMQSTTFRAKRETLFVMIMSIFPARQSDII